MKDVMYLLLLFGVAVATVQGIKGDLVPLSLCALLILALLIGRCWQLWQASRLPKPMGVAGYKEK